MTGEKEKVVSAIIEEVIEQMCDKYCRYPHEPVPEGKEDDWLINDDDSPCNSCPLNRLV